MLLDEFFTEEDLLNEIFSARGHGFSVGGRAGGLVGSGRSFRPAGGWARGRGFGVG